MPGAYTLDHVAVALPRLADAMGVVVGVLGAQPSEGGPGLGFSGAQWRFEGGGRLELLEPAGEPGGFLHRFLDARGAGVHHVTFVVPDLVHAIQRARTAGYRVVGVEIANETWKEAFLHPKSAQGIVVQLAEAHPELGGGGWNEHYPFPASPVPAVPAAELVGLRLRARSAERARKQWGEFLGGTEKTEGDALSFAWKDSPLRIAVGIDPDGEEGPIALELACERKLELADGPDPVLGIRLSQVE
jgi:methylmalonyl-CoA/ethylmalonyl-CoA epimerase